MTAPNNMNSEGLRAEIDRLHEEHLVRAFPDRKERAFARWYFELRNKAIAHKLLTGLDATVEDLLSKDKP